MKKTLSVLLTICMVLVCAVSAVSAENQTGDALDAISEIWTCPDCGKENDDAFCPWCGAKKPESPASPVVCSGCGAEYEPDTGYNFCKKCGMKLLKEDSPADDPAEKIKGVWTLTNVTGDEGIETRFKGMLDAGLCIRFTFADNGVLNYEYRLEYQDQRLTGTYTLEGNRMTIQIEGFEIDVVEYALSEDTLELNFDQYHYTMVLTRKTEK